MKTLARAVSAPDVSGQALPRVWRCVPPLRRGNLSVLAGPPGSGKTILAANLVKALHVPTLYVSPDSDESTMGSRLLALVTGEAIDTAEQWMRDYPQDCARRLHESCDHIRWIFEGVDLEGLWTEIQAWEECWGEYPTLIVVDVLLSLDEDTGDSSTVREVMKHLLSLARETNAAILVVSHTSEGDDKDYLPPPRSAVLYKVNQLPSLIVTVNTSPYGEMNVAVVKNRFGAGDKLAATYSTLFVDLSKGQVRER